MREPKRLRVAGHSSRGAHPFPDFTAVRSDRGNHLVVWPGLDASLSTTSAFCPPNTVCPCHLGPFASCIPPSAESSAGKLDWGTIGDDDGAYTLSKSATPGSASDGGTGGAIAGSEDRQRSLMAGSGTNGQTVKILSRSQALPSVPSKIEASTKLKSVVVVTDRHYGDRRCCQLPPTAGRSIA
jgi:hypothetical protein